MPHTWAVNRRYDNELEVTWDNQALTLFARVQASGGSIAHPILLDFNGPSEALVVEPLREEVRKQLEASEPAKRLAHARRELAEARRQVSLLEAKAAQVRAAKEAAILSRVGGLPPKLVAWERELASFEQERQTKLAEAQACEGILADLKKAAEADLAVATSRGLAAVRRKITEDRAAAMDAFVRDNAEVLTRLTVLHLAGPAAYNPALYARATAGLLEEMAAAEQNEATKTSAAKGAGSRAEVLQPA